MQSNAENKTVKISENVCKYSKEFYNIAAVADCSIQTDVVCGGVCNYKFDQPCSFVFHSRLSFFYDLPRFNSGINIHDTYIHNLHSCRLFLNSM